MNKESKCKYCRYLEQCPDIVEENSIYCMIHRRIPKKVELSEEKSNPISAYGSVSLEDLIEAAERLKKIPNYNDLLKENKDLKQALINIREYINNNCVFIDDSGYKKLIGYPKEMFDAQDILQIIDKVLGGSDESKTFS